MNRLKTYHWILLLLLLAGSTAAILFSVAKPSHSAENASEAGRLSAALRDVPHRFGFSLDSFHIRDARLEAGQTLGSLLAAAGLGASAVETLTGKVRSLLDPRSLKTGDRYHLVLASDSSRARYLVYEKDPLHYVVMGLGDSLRVREASRPVRYEEHSACGTIRHSLYEAMERNDVDPAMAVALSHIYAWSIDFYQIQPGDWFKVLYRQAYAGSMALGSSDIQAAAFHHDGATFYAYYFQPDSARAGSYYDSRAHSLRKVFLKAPLKFFRISSRYTLQRFHPILHVMKAHLGTDYAAPTGTPIMATGSGVVTRSAYTRFNGNYVKIRHNRIYSTEYLHMSKRLVKAGQYVRQGQVIGLVGMTGLATGPHVCYRFWKNGRQVDPYKQHFPPAAPLRGAERRTFDSLISPLEQRLAALPLDSLGARE